MTKVKRLVINTKLKKSITTMRPPNKKNLLFVLIQINTKSSQRRDNLQPKFIVEHKRLIVGFINMIRMRNS